MSISSISLLHFLALNQSYEKFSIHFTSFSILCLVGRIVRSVYVKWPSNMEDAQGTVIICYQFKSPARESVQTRTKILELIIDINACGS